MYQFWEDTWGVSLCIKPVKKTRYSLYEFWESRLDVSVCEYRSHTRLQHFRGVLKGTLHIVMMVDEKVFAIMATSNLIST